MYFANLQTCLGQRRRHQTGGTFFQRYAERSPGRYGEHRVFDHVQARNRQLSAATMRPFDNRELAASRGLLHFNGVDRSLFDARKNHARARPISDRSTEIVLRI